MNSDSGSQEVSSLVKVVQMHRKKTKINYQDPQLNFALTHQVTSVSPRNDLVDQYLRCMWAIFEQSYFRKLDQEDMRILDYIEGLGQTMTPKESRRKRNQQAPIDPYHSEIDLEIMGLEEKLLQVASQNETIIDSIKESILKQEENGVFLTKTFTSDKPLLHSKTVQRIQMVQKQLNYLPYQIGVLQKKQIADSTLKILKVQKQGSEVYLEVSFDSAFDLSVRRITQRQFIQLNSLREGSLLNFYFTGWKSLFNFTCQNAYGFQRLAVLDKRVTVIQKETSLSQIKTFCDVPLGIEEMQVFRKMEMCHQCRCLYDIQYLRKCGYKASIDSKIVIPNLHDPYLLSIIKQSELSLLKQRTLYSKTNLINSYFTYKIKQKTVSCQRYYCKLCYKAYAKLKHHVLCPFCQGLCNCSRCLRNDMIFKLKSLFVSLGGKIEQLNMHSHFQNMFKEKACSQRKEIEKNRSKNIQKIGAKLKFGHKEMEGLRMMSFMVKKREHTKSKMIKSKANLFRTELFKLGFSL